MSPASKIFSPARTNKRLDLVFGDLHLNDNPRDSYRHDFLANGLPGLIRQTKPKRLVILGDLTDEKDRHSAWLVNKVVDHLSNLQKLVRQQVVILRGNHDYLDEANPFFDFLNQIEGLRFISQPRWLDDVLFLPHTTDPERDWQGLKPAQLAFAHNTFAGAIGDSGLQLRGIPLETIPAERVISGDVHVPQICGKVTYVGAPYHIDFGDNFKPRMLLVNESSVSVDVGSLVRQKRLLDLSGPDDRELGKANPGDIVKIRVHLKYRDVAGWPAARERIAAWAQEQQLTVYQISPVIHYRPGARTVVNERKSDRRLVLEYSQSRGLDKSLKRAGLELL